MSSVTIHVLLSTTWKTRYSFINGTCGKLSHIFSSATFNTETVWGFGRWFQNIFMRHSSDTISPFHSNLESYQVAIVRVQAFADSSSRGTVERHVQCAQKPCILLNLPLHLEEVGCTLQ